MPLTPEFYDAIKDLDRNWSMGVELVSPLLYSLTRCVKPQSVLEIGAGYSTVFLLQGLADNFEEFSTNRELLEGHVRSDDHKGLRRLIKGKHPLPLAEIAYYEGSYRPLLSVIDDRSHPATSATKVEEVARKLKIDRYLRFYEGDFRGMSGKFDRQLLPFDFIWLDCGMVDQFLAEYWELLNPEGGFLLIHSALNNPIKLRVLNKLRAEQGSPGTGAFEMVSLLEPHKWRQNSLTMLRRISARMYDPEALSSPEQE